MKIIKSYRELCSYKCPICGGTGGHYAQNGDYTVWEECGCAVYKRIAARISASHMEDCIDEYTFAGFGVETDWQRNIKRQAVKYTQAILEGGKPWFYIGGQIGAGKTHIAIAMMRELFYRNKKCRMAMWRVMAYDIKGNMWEDEYGRVFDSYAGADILCIDDFFKGSKITDGDKNIAYDIINERYVKRLPTLITSEKPIEEIIDIDEAIGSRIRQMCGEYCVSIKTDKGKNQRMAI